MKCAIAEWETLTGMDSTEIGCTCCGVPHVFTEIDDDD